MIPLASVALGIIMNSYWIPSSQEMPCFSQLINCKSAPALRSSSVHHETSSPTMCSSSSTHSCKSSSIAQGLSSASVTCEHSSSHKHGSHEQYDCPEYQDVNTMYVSYIIIFCLQLFSIVMRFVTKPYTKVTCIHHVVPKQSVLAIHPNCHYKLAQCLNTTAITYLVHLTLW